MRIAIVEDEKYWQEVIQRRIELFYVSNVEIVCYSSGEEFIEKLKFFEIVFMDIELSGEDGFSTSRKYKGYFPESIIIILTTHNELCNKGYQIEAFRYIDKLHLEEIQEALANARTKLHQQEKAVFHVVAAGNLSVKCKNILYIETSGRNLAVHMNSGVCECTGNISAYALELESKGFYYIHRSYLVNVDAVFSFDRRKVILKNKEVLDMSIHRYRTFKEFYFEWKFVQGNG
ncbi:LytR/AlgR family response regulator transcription factor [Lacrimispora sp.]|uniref:LytR/AlgR family response regulator transcription factor n=1 Tax=Lacrimispora sp. TaxID=2719234 RepID=UPI0028A89061|nr:LytTR family DNA-binding domain-containing protein [Lacrimispora sp.]